MEKSLVLGFFDGVHLGHRDVVNSAMQVSDEVILLTFKDSPYEYFCGNAEYILSRENSVNRLKKLGIKEVIEYDFSSIVNMTALEYLEMITTKFNPDYIVTGFNHTFGLNKTGNPEFLLEKEQEFNYKYICTPPRYSGNEIISSTLIKNYLKKGNIPKATELLDGDFVLEGEVIHGAKIGRTIGFPTANLKYPPNIVQIPNGVYKTEVLFGGKTYTGMMNWGKKPTVNNTLEQVIEVNINDFDGDLYGKQIQISIKDKIRDEKKFNSLEELKTQIEKDKEACLR